MVISSLTRRIAAWPIMVALLMLLGAVGVSQARADVSGSGPADPTTSQPAAVAPQVPTPVITANFTPTTIPNDLQRITAGLPSDGFAGTPCANALNATCQVNAEDPPGGVSGTARVASDGMTVTVTVQPGLVPAASVANVFFPTTFGIENVDCPPAPTSGPVTCTGTAIANLIQGSTIRVFAGNVQVATAQVVGPGAATPTPVPTSTPTTVLTATPIPSATPPAPTAAPPPPTAAPPPPTATAPEPPAPSTTSPAPDTPSPDVTLPADVPPDVSQPVDAPPDATPSAEAPPPDVAPTPDTPPDEQGAPPEDSTPPAEPVAQ